MGIVITNSKYKHEFKVWKMKQVPNYSQSWIAACKRLDIVTGDLRWEIGDGKCIHVLDDPWLDTFPLICASYLVRNQELLHGRSVSFFFY